MAAEGPWAGHEPRCSAALQELRGCWPLVDSKCRSDFLAFMRKWITDLGKEALLPPDAVQLFPSTYQNAHGARTVDLLNGLCTLALKAELERSFPGAVNDVAPSLTDEASVTTGWAAHQGVTQAQQQREETCLSHLLATLQRLQEVLSQAAPAGELTSAGAGAAAAGVGSGLWSTSSSHRSRVQALQGVLGSGLRLSDRPGAATPAALGRLLLPSGPSSSKSLGEGEGAPPRLAGEAPPEHVLQCLSLRLEPPVKQLVACCGDRQHGSALADKAANSLVVQGALPDLHIDYSEWGTGKEEGSW